MGLKEQLTADLKEALRSGDETRKSTIRLALDALHKAEIPAEGETIDSKRALDEEAAQKILADEAKKRRDSIAEFERGGRPDLAARERAELEVLLEYLPPQLSQEEIARLARETIHQMGASGPAQMGQVMKALMPQIQGRADGKVVSQVVRQLLESGA